jgi:hypothetical protein
MGPEHAAPDPFYQSRLVLPFTTWPPRSAALLMGPVRLG